MTQQNQTQEEKMGTSGYVTVARCAEMMGVHFATVHRNLDDKKIHGCKVGGRQYVLVESIVEYLGEEASRALGILG